MLNPREFGFAITILASITFVQATAGELKFSDCPDAVQETLKREANGAEIAEVKTHTDDGETVYGTDVTIDGRHYEIVVEEDGTLLEKALNEDEDVKVKLSNCPPAVQKTLKREMQGAEIEVVDKEIRDGRTIYYVDVEIDDNVYEIQVDEAGVLISKALHEEEERQLTLCDRRVEII